MGRLGGIVAALLLQIAPPLLACNVSIEGRPVIGNIAYNPFDPVPAIATVTIPIKNNGSKTCDGAIGFVKIGSLAARGGGPFALSYELASQTSGASLLTQAATPTGRPQVYLAAPGLRPGEVRMLAYRIKVPPGQLAPPGIYSDTFEAVAYQGSASALTSAGSAIQLSVNFGVEVVMSVNIAGGGQAVALDFGSLAAGATRSVTIQARSNQSYRFVVSSEQGGVMRLDPAPSDGMVWKIPYTVRIGNGGELTLNADRKIPISQGATALGGSSIPMEIKIGDPSNQRAGRYKDVITVKIDALL
jgi:spore coat protein U-like protein